MREIAACKTYLKTIEPRVCNMPLIRRNAPGVFVPFRRVSENQYTQGMDFLDFLRFVTVQISVLP